MLLRRTTRLVWALALLVSACGRGSGAGPIDATPPAPAAARPAAPASHADVPKIVVLGDSLTAGLGLSPSQAYPALLQQKLDAAGYKWDVVNAGVSGDTSAAGLERVDWALDQGHVRI